MNRQRDHQELLAEIAALRDRAERACQETERLRRFYQVAVDRTRWAMQKRDARMAQERSEGQNLN